jgi:hypothetical protein
MAVSDQKPVYDASQLSDPEKVISHGSDRLAGFEDPDAGLSDEERAKIV